MLFTLQCGCMGPTMSFRHGAQRAWVIGCIDPAGLEWVQFHLICLGIRDFDPEIIQNCSLSIRKSMVWGTQTSWNTHMAMISRGWIPSYGGKNPGYAHDHPDTPSCFISSTGKEVGCGSQEDGPSTGRNIGPEKNGWKTRHLWIILQPRNHVFFFPIYVSLPQGNAHRMTKLAGPLVSQWLDSEPGKQNEACKVPGTRLSICWQEQRASRMHQCWGKIGWAFLMVVDVLGYLERSHILYKKS